MLSDGPARDTGKESRSTGRGSRADRGCWAPGPWWPRAPFAGQAEVGIASPDWEAVRHPGGLPLACYDASRPRRPRSPRPRASTGGAAGARQATKVPAPAGGRRGGGAGRTTSHSLPALPVRQVRLGRGGGRTPRPRRRRPVNRSAMTGRSPVLPVTRTTPKPTITPPSVGARRPCRPTNGRYTATPHMAVRGPGLLAEAERVAGGVEVHPERVARGLAGLDAGRTARAPARRGSAASTSASATSMSMGTAAAAPPSGQVGAW